MTLDFIGVLLRSNSAAQDDFYRRQIPEGVFPHNKAEVHWVYWFREKYGHYPSVAAFKSRFEGLELPKRRKETVFSSLETVLALDKFNRMRAAVDEARKHHEAGEPINDTLSLLTGKLTDIRDYSTEYTDLIVGKSDVADEKYRARVLSKKSTLSLFHPTPWDSMNDLLGFCEHGEHNIIAARTNLGKTWIALYMAIHFAKIGEKVLFITKEMPTTQILNRFECCLFKLPYPDFREGRLKPAVLRKWRTDKEIYSKTAMANRLIVSGEETVSGTGLKHIITKIQEHQPTVIFVDGAYLIYPEAQKFNSDVLRFTYISNTMKRLAKAYSLISYSVIQGNREGESKSGDTRISLRNIYGADAWAQDADNVFLLSGKRGASQRILSLAKGRESNIGEFVIKFQLSPYPDFPPLASVAIETPTLDFNITE